MLVTFQTGLLCNNMNVDFVEPNIVDVSFRQDVDRQAESELLVLTPDGDE